MEGMKYEVLKPIRGFTIPSIRAEVDGKPVDGVYGRDRFYLHYETIPEGEELQLFINYDVSQMGKLRAEGFVREIGRFVVPDEWVEIARSRFKRSRFR